MIRPFLNWHSRPGQWRRGYVSGPGVGVVATRAAASQTVEWMHTDPVTGSRRRTGATGAEVAETTEEVDPLGVDVGRCNPYFGGCGSVEDAGGKGGLLSPSRYGNAPDRRAGCSLAGMAVMCDVVSALLESGAGIPDPSQSAFVFSRRRRRAEPLPGEADAPQPGAGGGDTALAFHGGGGGGFNPDIIREWVTVTASRDFPVEVEGGMMVGGLFLRVRDPQNPTVVQPSKPIPDLVRDLLKKGDCADYVQKLLDRANEGSSTVKRGGGDF